MKYFTIPFHSPWNSHDAHLFKEKQSTAPKKMSVLLWWTAIRHYCLALNWYFRLPNLRECSMPPQVHFGWQSRWCQIELSRGAQVQDGNGEACTGIHTAVWSSGCIMARGGAEEYKCGNSRTGARVIKGCEEVKRGTKICQICECWRVLNCNSKYYPSVRFDDEDDVD